MVEGRKKQEEISLKRGQRPREPEDQHYCVRSQYSPWEQDNGDKEPGLDTEGLLTKSFQFEVLRLDSLERRGIASVLSSGCWSEPNICKTG